MARLAQARRLVNDGVTLNNIAFALGHSTRSSPVCRQATAHLAVGLAPFHRLRVNADNGADQQMIAALKQ